MHPRVMRDWAPAARFLGPARLRHFRLEFLRRSIRWQAGAADVIPAPGEEVWGALYVLPDLAPLDEKEFVAARGYRQLAVTVEVDGRPVTAITYEVVDKAPAPLVPKAAYVELLVAGATARGLPPAWVRRLETTKGAP